MLFRITQIYCLLLLPAILLAQTNIQVENLSLEKGLSHRLVLDIHQDRQGFMWFPSFYGLNRYDGTKMEVFVYHPQNPDAFLPSDRYSCIAEDTKGQLWVGSVLGRIMVFDPLAHEFQRFEHEPNHPESLQSLNIQNIYTTLKNRIYIVGSRIDGIDPTEVLLEEYLGNGKFRTLLDFKQRILHLIEDIQGNLWLITHKGYYYFNTKTNTLSPYQINMGGQLDISDSNNQLWIPSFPVSNQLKAVSLPKEIPPNDWQSFVFDNKNNIWLKCRNGQVYHVDNQKEMVEYYGNFPIYPDHIFRIYESDEGIIWTTESKGGVNKIRKNKTYFDTYLNASSKADNVRKDDISIIDFVETENGQVLALNSGGQLFTIDSVATSLNLTLNFNQKEQPQNYSLVAGIGDTIWANTKNLGLVSIDIKNKTFNTYRKDATVPRRTNRIIKDHQNRIWVENGKGISLFDTNTKTFEPYTGKANTIFHSYFDRKNKSVWLLPHYELIAINANTFEEKHITIFTKTEVGRHGHYDAIELDGFLWIASFNGLIKLDLNTEQFEVFTIAHGLSSNVIYSMVTDGENLWLGTYNGLTHFNTNNYTSTIFGKEEGLPHAQFNAQATLKATDGCILMGTKNGMISFRPSDIKKQEKEIPTLVWTGFEKYNSSNKTALKYTYHQLDSLQKIILKYNDQSITFRMALLDFSNPEKNQYAYFLEGYDRDWNYLGNTPFVTFPFLPPGDYIFKAKAANAAGQWTATELAIPINVRQIWYWRWWAWLLFGSVISTIGLLFYRFQLKRNLEREEARRLIELDNLKNRLYTNITHEFRTPLTVILGMAAQIKAKFSNKKEQERYGQATNLIEKNGQQLLGLVNQMLDLTKLESGSMSLRWVQGSVVIYIKYIVESFENFAKTKNIRLHFLSNLETLEMDYDEEKLLSILSNLLSNAIKFTDKGGNIYVHVQTITKEQEFLNIKIADTGRGIPDEKLPYIFNRFYQVDDTTTRQGEGTGIGLSLVKELVHLWGGTIEVNSKLGEGTAFEISLPVVQNSKGNGVQTATKSSTAFANDFTPIVPLKKELPIINQQQNGTTSAAELPLLLIIEDNADVAEYIQSCLEKEYQTVYAENGQLGIEKAIEIIPDIIISDVMMPEKDGFEVVKTLKNDEKTSHVPIVLLTAKADIESKLTGLQSGADAYLSKPFNKQELLIRLEKLTELRRQLQLKYGQGLPLSNKSQPLLKHQNLEDTFLKKLNEVLEKHLSDTTFSVENLSKKMAMSRSQLHRKLKALTDQSVTIYWRSYRLQKAKQILESEDVPVSEVAYRVGFADPSYFTRVFVKEFGVKPSEITK